MPRITDIVTDTLDDDAFLEKMTRRHQARLLSSIGKLRDDITGMMSQLETTPAGKLMGVKVNLKQSQQLHKKLLIEFEREYGKTVDSVIGDFSEISSLVNRRYRHLGEAAKFTSIDKTMMETLKNQTYDRYKEFGDNARDQIARTMYDSVVGGQKFSTLQKSITGILTGHKDVRGRPMTLYAKGFAQDAVMNFHNQVNVKKGEDAGMNHFLYYGDIINSSRSFCITRVGKTYSKAQIQAWDTVQWQGKAGPALTDRGGYNCRHHWRPVRPEWFKDEIDDEEISREEIVAYMNPAAPGVKKTIAKIKKVEDRLNTGKNKLKELQAKQLLFKTKKAADKVSAKEVTDYSALRKQIKTQQLSNAEVRAELKGLKVELKGQGKSIVKKAKKSVVVKKKAVAKKASSKVKKVSLVKEPGASVIKTKLPFSVYNYKGVKKSYVNSVVKDLESIPNDILKKASEVEMHIGKNMTQINPSLKGVKVRGWGDKTWDYVEGGYRSAGKKISIAERKLNWTGDWVTVGIKRRRSVVVHEFGHALDDSMGHVSSSKEFINAYKKDLKFIAAQDFPDTFDVGYFVQEGVAGREETFAELFANMMDAGYLNREIDDLFVNSKRVIEKRLGLEKAVKKPTKVVKATEKVAGKKALSKINKKVLVDELGQADAGGEYILSSIRMAADEVFDLEDKLAALYGKARETGSKIRIQKSLKLNSLVGFQEVIDKKSVSKIVENFESVVKKSKAPLVLRYEGRNILYDGYHRTNAAKLLGKKTMDFDVVDLDKAVKKPTKVVKKVKGKLTSAQAEAIEFAGQMGELTPDRLKKLSKKFNMGVAEVEDFAKSFKSKSKMAVVRRLNPDSASFKDLFENGKLKNQYELGKSKATSSGSKSAYKGGTRDMWEKKSSGGAFQRSDEYKALKNKASFTKELAEERPMYGYVIDPLDRATRITDYGGVEFVLKNKYKKTSTLIKGDSSVMGGAKNYVGNFDNPFPILDSIKGRALKDLKAGKRRIGGWSSIDHFYAEAQIYGGIDLAAGDVAMITVNKSDSMYRRFGAKHIEKLAKKYKIKLKYVSY